jgi:hypothetical protein
MKISLVSSTLVSLGVLMAASAPAHAGPEKIVWYALRWTGVIQRGALTSVRIGAYEWRSANASRSYVGRSGYLDREFGSLIGNARRDIMLSDDLASSESSLLRSSVLDRPDRLAARSERLRKLLEELEAGQANVFEAKALDAPSSMASETGKLRDMVRSMDDVATASLRPRLSTDISKGVVNEVSVLTREAKPAVSEAAAKAPDKKSIIFNPFNGELKFGELAKFEGESVKFALEGKANAYLLGAIGVGAYYCHEKECVKKVAQEGLDETFGFNKLAKVVAEAKPKSVIEAD